MDFDPSNPVVTLCAAGMLVEGDPEAARALFEQAWTIRTNDWEGSVAAHYLARHQDSAEDTCRWNAVALEHADRLSEERARELLPSLCVNLADSYLRIGNLAAARALAERAAKTLALLPESGYTALLRAGIARLKSRLSGVTPSAEFR